jgi:hypothetical protein
MGMNQEIFLPTLGASLQSETPNRFKTAAFLPKT